MQQLSVALTWRQLGLLDGDGKKLVHHPLLLLLLLLLALGMHEVGRAAQQLWHQYMHALVAHTPLYKYTAT